MYLRAEKKTHRSIVLAVILFIALWFRYPFIGAGLPYFYDEDEAHHFNRVVNMVKKGEYNPHYFLKPSLHFYLRMPLVALGFLHEVKEGRARKITDIDTEDRFGIGGYAFSTSHPAVVKMSRLLSLLLGLGVVLLTGLLALELTGSLLAGAVSSLLVAVAPSLVPSSATIGVDSLACFFCTLTVYLAVRTIKSFSPSSLAATAVASGLAIGSKYNAAPIVVLPILSSLISQRFAARYLLISLAVPLLTFLATSPFIIVSLPLFLDHVAYEIWHYGIAGHEGHTEEPGIRQALFYLNWLTKEGIGILPLLLAFGGVSLATRRKELLLVAAFPLLYFVLMSGQRANFTRNMHVVIPFVALFGAVSLSRLNQWLCDKRWAISLIASIVILPTVWSGYQATRGALIPETRLLAGEFIRHRVAEGGDVAVEGELQFEPNALRSERVTAIPRRELDVATLSLTGYSDLVVSKGSLASLPTLPTVRDIPGDNLKRIVANPAIVALSLTTPEADAMAREKAKTLFRLEPYRGGNYTLCVTTEGHCWLSSRKLFLPMEGTGRFLLKGEAMSPWQGQSVNDVKLGEPGRWQEIAIPIEIQEGGAWLTVKEIHLAPQDGRRLGVALRKISITAEKELPAG